MQKTDTISLDTLKQNLLSQRLLPSQSCLTEGIDEKFELIKRRGLEDVNVLLDVLKNKTKLSELAHSTGIVEKYLSVLKREVSAYQLKPIKISDFTMISEFAKKKLEETGIKNTVQFIGQGDTKGKRLEIAQRAGVMPEEIELLAKLCDLSRLRYVNVAFAELLARSGYDTVAKVKSADYIKLYEELSALNEGKKYYTGHLGKNDMDYLVRDRAYANVDMEL